MEIRDCCLVSKSKAIDAAFLMHDTCENYRGILSVKSCHIEGFSYGFLAAANSILSIELSCIRECRATAIYAENPRILKISGTILEQIDHTGIELLLSSKLRPEVCLEDNKVSYCKGYGMRICAAGNGVKIVKNRVYKCGKAGIKVGPGEEVEVIGCDVGGCGLVVKRVKGVNIGRCRVTDSDKEGITIRDCQEVKVHECEVSTCKLSGLLFQDTALYQSQMVKAC